MHVLFDFFVVARANPLRRVNLLHLTYCPAILALPAGGFLTRFRFLLGFDRCGSLSCNTGHEGGDWLAEKSLNHVMSDSNVG